VRIGRLLNTVVTYLIPILGLIVGAIGMLIAVLGIRKPKLTVATMFVPNSQWFAPYGGDIRVQQERHEGPHPDDFLRVILRNHGWVPAMRVSGSLLIYPPVFEPVNFPGYTETRVLLHHGGPAFEAHIPASDFHTAPPEPTRDPLVFEIPIRWQQRDWESAQGHEERFERRQALVDQEVRIIYRFVPETGASIEGEWIPALSVPPAAKLPANSGCVKERRLSWWRRVIEKYKVKDERIPT
jgi:hypothetical protein